MAVATEERICYRPNEAARVLGLCRDQVFRLIAAGELRSIKVGRARLIRREELLAWIERHEREAVTA